MVVSAFLFETRGGQIIAEVEPAKFDWSVQANTPETLSATFKPYRGLSNFLTPWKHSLAFDVGGLLLGGPILPEDYDGDAHQVRVQARGLGLMFDRAYVLPVSALSAQLAPGGAPDPSFDTSISGVELGTVAKRLVQQQLAWPGWTDIPVTLPADRPGSAVRNYTAVELKSVWSALSDLTGVENGPDIRFRLTRTSTDTFGWTLETGTAAQPRLQGEVPLVWEPDDTSGLQVRSDPQVMGSMSWSVGGRSTDKTLIRSMYDPDLVSRGFPLLHLKSDASSSTVLESTLDSWNVETLRTARVPAQFWSFKVPTDRSPFPFEYREGDLAQIVVRGHEYLDDGTYTRRIVGLSGDESGFITVTCGVYYGGV